MIDDAGIYEQINRPGTCNQAQQSTPRMTPSILSTRFTNNHLPALFLKERKWAKKFLPTLFLWLGDQANVWAVPEDDLIRALREITKVVYPTFTNLDEIAPSMPIFSVVCHLYFIDTVFNCV